MKIWKFFQKIAIVVFIHKNSNIIPRGNIVQETTPLKVIIESTKQGPPNILYQGTDIYEKSNNVAEKITKKGAFTGA